MIQPLLDKNLPLLIDLRHRLHQIPELGYEERQTAAAIRAELDRLGIRPVAGVKGAPTATIAWIGDASKPCIALRADIDALPIAERTGLPYASINSGRMHACGHDGHSAGLVGTAAVLKEIEPKLRVCVKLIWQPAEEGGAGADRLINAGVLDGRVGPKASAIFGLHGWPGLKIGLVAGKGGELLAGMDNFDVTFTGRGSHGGYPHLGRDPIVAAAEAVVNLQQIVAREVDPTDSVVITVGKIEGGTAVNVIPDDARFSGTARTLNEKSRACVQQSILRRCAGIAAAHDCRISFDWKDGYPPLVNDTKMADFVAQTARAALGADRFIPVAKPSMGAEDFAFYLRKVPGCFFMLGVEPADRSEYPGLHSDRYDFPDDALEVAMRMFVELALRFPI